MPWSSEFSPAVFSWDFPWASRPWLSWLPEITGSKAKRRQRRPVILFAKLRPSVGLAVRFRSGCRTPASHVGLLPGLEKTEGAYLGQQGLRVGHGITSFRARGSAGRGNLSCTDGHLEASQPISGGGQNGHDRLLRRTIHRFSLGIIIIIAVAFLLGQKPEMVATQPTRGLFAGRPSIKE